MPAPVSPRVAPADSLADTIRVCSGGDVTLGTNLDTTWAVKARARYGRHTAALPSPDSLVTPLRALLGDADIVLVNVEGAIGDEPTPFSKCRRGSTNCYAFRQPAATAAALRGLRADGAVVGNVANNHARDAGAPGLDTTVARLVAAGVVVTGMDTIATPAWSAHGDTVAFLGFSTSGGPDPRDLAAVRRHVARAAARWPRVVVTMHMGAEGAKAQRTRDTTEIFLGTVDRGNSVAFARAAAESGADLVIGHGPHVMRAIEWHGDVLAAYSLGNLLTYGPFTLTEPMNRAGLLCATLAADGRVIAAELRPTWQRPPGLVAPDSSSRAAIIADSLGHRDFPFTAARLTREGRILRPAPHHP